MYKFVTESFNDYYDYVVLKAMNIYEARTSFVPCSFNAMPNIH